MAMSFRNELRGHLAESILVMLLERGGFRATRFGIEALFDEVKFLPLHQYLNLGLPKALRELPDLLVTNLNVSWAKLIEVKFRQRFDEDAAKDLHSDLTEQRQYWPDSYAIILIAEPFAANARFHQDCIRVVPPRDTDKLLYAPEEGTYDSERKRMEWVWDRLPMMSTLFPSPFHYTTPEEKKRSQEFWSSADHITGLIKDLGKC